MKVQYNNLFPDNNATNIRQIAADAQSSQRYPNVESLYSSGKTTQYDNYQQVLVLNEAYTQSAKTASLNLETQFLNQGKLSTLLTKFAAEYNAARPGHAETDQRLVNQLMDELQTILRTKDSEGKFVFGGIYAYNPIPQDLKKPENNITKDGKNFVPYTRAVENKTKFEISQGTEVQTDFLSANNKGIERLIAALQLANKTTNPIFPNVGAAPVEDPVARNRVIGQLIIDAKEEFSKTEQDILYAIDIVKESTDLNENISSKIAEQIEIIFNKTDEEKAVELKTNLIKAEMDMAATTQLYRLYQNMLDQLGRA